MADAEPRKRSRFDQKEPEPKRASRFDRRSRSPTTSRTSETRERSPIGSSESAVDPATAAAAAAAKINAQLQARKGIQHVDVPPILGATSNGTPEASSTAPESGKGAPGAPGEMYVSDGDYIQDIEVNDLRNRYMLMKAQTQQSIQKDTGADLTVRGKYYPNKSMATAAEPPLYLHITARTKEVLEAAVAKVNELIEQELPQLVDERRFKRRERDQPEGGEENGRRNKWPEESIPVGLEPVPGFNLRAQIVGAGGSYVKHIQQETGCRVQIKGRGSGYIERDTNLESEEEMFLHVAGPDPAMVERGRELCQDLIDNVREQYEEFRSRPPRQHGDRYGGDRGDRGDRGYGGDRRGGYNDRGGDHYSGRGGGGGDSYSSYGRQNSESGPANAAVSTDTTANADYNAQYAQYYAQAAANGQDPYAAYGGYANYLVMYQQYYAQYQQGQGGAAQSPTQAPGASPPPPPSDSAPPPPPSNAAPPPPPSASPPGAPGSYSAVPPPPGL
ncbi:KH domain protein [Cordyceps militaris CM01]|uniref:KH domain protein n=1 Tax=Cordyceps militaris (strain CM01) TaxID=983644 RepID=G3JSA4_CORMM|nr:KH domain protein [Cordyceps militaris CM01]EGX88803.1 KH domain protein [Cordyceps militaris CM01]